MEAFFNHLNPAIIRRVMRKMNQKEFEDCMKFIVDQALKLEPGTKRDMYVNMFGWCQEYYKKAFAKKEPSLF
jgi:hypothetical protein